MGYRGLAPGWLGAREVLAAAALGWAAALPIAALAAGGAGGGTAGDVFALAVYGLGAALCHQRPERSFFLWAAQFPVCGRCAGLYAGAAAASLVVFVPAWPTRGRFAQAARAAGTPRRVLAAGAVPTLLTLAFEGLAGGAPSNATRAAAGFVLGAAVAAILLQALGSPANQVD